MWDADLPFDDGEVGLVDREGKDGVVVAMEGNVGAIVQWAINVLMVDETLDEQ